MTWIARALQVSVHYCRPPMRDDMREIDPEHEPMVIGERPDGNVGDLWRCDECRELWRIIKRERQRYANIFPDPYPRWREAGWWLRFRHRNTEPPQEAS